MAQCGVIVTTDGLPAMTAGPERHQAARSWVVNVLQEQGQAQVVDSIYKAGKLVLKKPKREILKLKQVV